MDWRALLSNQLTWPAVLVASFGVLFGLQVWTTRRTKRLLREGAEALVAWDPSSSPADDHALCSHVRTYLLSEVPADLGTWLAPRLVLTQPLDDVIDSYVERKRTGLWRFTMTSSATGFALFCTFVLIAIVLTKDVREALRATSGMEDLLSNAVGLLGQKFYISATGIFLAIISTALATLSNRQLDAAVHDACLIARSRFCTAEAVAAATQLEVLTELRTAGAAAETRAAKLDGVRDAVSKVEAAAVETRGEVAVTRQVLGERLEALHGQVETANRSLLDVRNDLQKLQSIEVSVKDLGTEVTQQFQKMLTEDVGNQIRDMLAEVMKHADGMADRLRSELVDGFQRAINEEVPKILESLQSIQKSVDGQASTPVERMLQQLQDVVSGGFKGESAQMGTAMRQFAEVVPALAEQLRTIASTVTTDMQARTEQTMRSSEALVAQVGTLLERLEAQQAATERAVSEIARTMTAGAQTAMKQLEDGSSAVVSSVVQSSRAEIDALLQRLEAATTTNAQTYASLDQSVASAAKSILQARDGLLQACDSTKALAAEARGVISDAKQSSDQARSAASGFQQAAAVLSDGLAAMRQTVDAARAQAAAQQATLEEHRRVFKELEQIWPGLFDKYLKSFDEKSDALAQGWKDVYGHVSRLSEAVGQDLMEAAEELKSSVDRLTVIQGGKVA